MDEKILQFGEGNFLRAFVDYFVDELNGLGFFNGSVVVVQPIARGMAETLNAQECRYTVLLRGLLNKQPTVVKREVSCISRAINPYERFNDFLGAARNPHLRYIVSNTTEAGITFVGTDRLTDKPPSSFPAKVTSLLYERFKFCRGDKSKGFVFIPCELVDDNGSRLKEMVSRYARLWQMPQGFIEWLRDANHFTNTLVDRIVTGFPKDETDQISAIEAENGYRDELVVAGEIFHFFAIEASPEIRKEISEAMPFHEAGLNVMLTDDVAPYKLRKVRILNGGHTMSVLAAYLSGIDTVLDMMNDPLFTKYLRKGIYSEVMPTLDGKLPQDELDTFAESVFERFANPYLKHYLLDISLNSVSKYRARVLPTVLEFNKEFSKLPPLLTLSFAALSAFYKGTENEDGAFVGERDGEPYVIKDDPDILTYFKNEWGKVSSGENDLSAFVRNLCKKVDFWGEDLTSLSGFCEQATAYLKSIVTYGMRATLENILGEYT